MPKEVRGKKAKVTNEHHLCYCRSDWNKPYARAIRGHWYTVMEIPMHTLHEEIHREIPCISPPNELAAKYAYEGLLMLEALGSIKKDDKIEERLSFLIELFNRSRSSYYRWVYEAT